LNVRRVQARAVTADPRLDLAVVEPRLDLDPQRDRPAHAVDHPQQQPAVGVFAALVEGQTVDQPRLSAR
jgi:hypothetical protein